MDLPKFHPNERVDLGDVEFLSEGQLGEFQRTFTNFVVGEATMRVLDGFGYSIQSATILQISIGKAVLAENRNAVVRYGQLVGGGEPVEGPASQNVSFSGRPVGSYGVYIRFVYGEGQLANRAFWDTITDLEEVQAVNTRKVASWQVTVASDTTSPGAEWYKIFTVAWDGSSLSTSTITDRRTFLFEGPADSSPQPFRPTWGSGFDRNNDRATYGVKTLERFASAVLKKIEEIQSDTPTTRWWSPTVEPLDKKVSRFGDGALAGNYLPIPDATRNLGSNTFRWNEIHGVAVRANDHLGRTSGATTARVGMSTNVHTLYTDSTTQSIDELLPETNNNRWRVRFGGATDAVSVSSTGVAGSYLMQARSWQPYSDAAGFLGTHSVTWGEVWSGRLKSYYSSSDTANPDLSDARLMVDNRSTALGAYAAIGWTVGSGSASSSHLGDGWIAYAKRLANNDVDLIFAQHNDGVFVENRAFFDSAGRFKIGPRSGTGFDDNLAPRNAYWTLDPGVSARAIIGGWNSSPPSNAEAVLGFTASSGFGPSASSQGAASFGQNYWWIGVNDTDWTDTGPGIEGDRFFAQFAISFGLTPTHSTAVLRVMHSRLSGNPFLDGSTGVLIRGGRNHTEPSTPEELMTLVGNHKIVARGSIGSTGSLSTDPGNTYNAQSVSNAGGGAISVTFNEDIDVPYTIILTSRGLASTGKAFVPFVTGSPLTSGFAIDAEDVDGAAVDMNNIGGSGAVDFLVIGRANTAPG